MTLDRTQRQLLGITKWRDSGCRGTLQWCTGVGKFYFSHFYSLFMTRYFSYVFKAIFDWFI